MASAPLHSSRVGARFAAAAVPRPPRRGAFLAHAAVVPGRTRPRGQPTRPYASKPTTGAAPTTPARDPDHADADPASAKRRKEEQKEEEDDDGGRRPRGAPSPAPGAMSRRLAEATEDALLTGGRAGRRAVEDAGFSEELKARLLAKVQDAQFRSEHAAAFAEAGLAGGAGARVPPAASGPAWTGEEPTADAVRRMLQDAHRPLRPVGGGGGGGKPRLPDLQPIDLRLAPAPRASAGARAAAAREKAGAYADGRTGTAAGAASAPGGRGRSGEERAAFRREMQERFGPAGRTMPATLTGLASLANERIEDAMARGQFRDIARGAAAAQRDARADNPFVDTTEYIMNKMIQRQDLVPPWIEKQQELLKAARVFRTRLRSDWRRHVARMIAAEGGSLDHQLRRARRLARAEALLNPQTPATTTTTTPADDAVGGLAEAERRVLSEWAAEEEAEAEATTTTTTTSTTATTTKSRGSDAAGPPGAPPPSQEEAEDATVLPRPFRDADWLAAERAYMEAAVAHLNTLTRSYNLMAPELAKKPYFSLERELARCYADVAPQVAAAIRDRAAAPAARPSPFGGPATARRPGILDRFGAERDGARVYDSRAPHYGFREMWRDLFGGGKTG